MSRQIPTLELRLFRRTYASKETRSGEYGTAHVGRLRQPRNPRLRSTAAIARLPAVAKF
jgi:hypothetical protein